jgi:hypothetical protein
MIELTRFGGLAMTASATTFATTFRRHFAPVLALVGAAALGCASLALAQSTTSSSTINGTVAGPGRIARTIIDAQPNGKVQSVNYPVGYTVTNGQTPAQVALGYRDSLNAYLGGAGFRAYFSPGYTTNNVRLTKITNGTFFATAESTTAGGVAFTHRNLNVEDAPIASPWLFASLLAGFTTLAWRTRRRRRTA